MNETKLIHYKALSRKQFDLLSYPMRENILRNRIKIKKTCSLYDGYQMLIGIEDIYNPTGLYIMFEETIECLNNTFYVEFGFENYEDLVMFQLCFDNYENNNI